MLLTAFASGRCWGWAVVPAGAGAALALKPPALAAPARDISESSAPRPCVSALSLPEAPALLLPPAVPPPLSLVALFDRWRRKAPFILDSNEGRAFSDAPRSSLSRTFVALLPVTLSDELVASVYDDGFGRGGGFGGGAGPLCGLFLTGRSHVAAASASR